MANLLTGDFEAAVQFTTRQINGVLGTLHQNGAIESAVLKLLHSASLRIGDPPRRPPEFDILQDWLIEYQKARPGRGLRDIRTQLTTAAPPGMAKLLTDAFAGIDANPVFEISSGSNPRPGEGAKQEFKRLVAHQDEQRRQ